MTFWSSFTHAAGFGPTSTRFMTIEPICAGAKLNTSSLTGSSVVFLTVATLTTSSFFLVHLSVALTS